MDRKLTISITQSYDFPIVAVRGAMNPSHAQTIEDVIDGFRSQDTNSIALDVSQVSFPDVESASALIRALRMVKPEMRVAAIADRNTASLLQLANLGSAVKVCSGIDEAVSFIVRTEDYYTSRWMAPTSQDEELPLAA